MICHLHIKFMAIKNINIMHTYNGVCITLIDRGLANVVLWILPFP